VARGHGEGSIYRRGSDGRWVAQIEAGRDENKRRRYARAVRRTRKEAQAALKELIRAADAGLRPGQSSTVEAFLAWWLDNALGDVTDATKARYRRTVDDWIVPQIGKVRLNKLAPADVQRMLVRLEERGLSPKSRQLARDVLSRALRWAEQTNVVGRNVARIVQGPKSTRKISDALTADEAKAVLAQARGDRLEALAVVALRLGLRRGEALELRWVDVDLGQNELTVNKGKTRAAARTVPLVAGSAAALREHRLRQVKERVAAGPLWRDSGLVFTMPRGGPIHPRIALDWWHKLTEAAGVGRRRFHAARHTTAVLLLDQGVPLEIVSAVLGHANLSITADVYARVTQDAKRRALAKLDDANA
jgi:integrase